MVLKKKNQGNPFTDLRSRLEEYAGMKHQQKDWYEPREIDEKRNLFAYYPFSALWQMHRFLLLKLGMVVMIMMVVFALTFVKMPFAVAILQNINHLTTWETDFGSVGREVLPTVQRLWTGSVEDGLEKPVFAPGVDVPVEGREASCILFSEPVKGEVVRNFGIYEDNYGDTKMSYGLLFSAPGENSVYAAAEGLVKEINKSPDGGYNLILEHQGMMETYYDYLKEVLVDEGETVSQGEVMGYTGVEQVEGGGVLYFETRVKGHPVDPLHLLLDY